MESQRKRAVITGGGSGIGLAIAKLLFPEFDLLLVGRSRSRLERGREEILESFASENCGPKERGAGSPKKAESDPDSGNPKKERIRLEVLDVSNFESVRDFHKRLLEEGRMPDLIVNAAGFGTIGRFTETDLSRECAETDTNCKGILHMMKLFLPEMIEGDRGAILNVSSSAGYMPGSPEMAVYYATKSYVLSLTRSVREELREMGSHVYLGALCPGPVRTGFTGKAVLHPSAEGGERPGKRRGDLSSISPEQCAKAALRGIRRKRAVIVPGFFMKFTIPASKILPASLLLRLAGLHQKRKQN